MIDASVLVKWYVQEVDSDKALVLRDRHVNGEVELAAPVLISYETLNALKYTGLFSNKELKDIAVSIQKYGISLHGLERKTAELTLDAVEKNDITVYDASYLGLAMNLGTEFITADQKLIDLLAGNYSKTVKHLRMT
ncbi:MAG: type II toxin-antitoxin system VapC family toxin, partial [Nitrososphaerales archaeon]